MLFALFNSDRISGTNWNGTTYHSISSTLVLLWSSCCLRVVFCVVLCRSWFVLLSRFPFGHWIVCRWTISDYSFVSSIVFIRQNMWSYYRFSVLWKASVTYSVVSFYWCWCIHLDVFLYIVFVCLSESKGEPADVHILAFSTCDIHVWYSLWLLCVITSI